MPQFIPMAIGLGGALLGGASKSGSQGGMNQQQTQQFQNQGATTGTMTPNEPGYATDFRKGIQGDINQAIGQAQAPVYGEAQKAGYLNNLNDLANGSMDALKQNLARSGALTSGRLSQGATDIGMNRNNQAAGFFSQIPFLNQQAKTAALNPLLGMGANFAGQAPVGYSQSGTQQQSGTSQGTTQQQQQGPGFLKGFLGGLAGMAGQGAYGSGPFAYNNWGSAPTWSGPGSPGGFSIG